MATIGGRRRDIAFAPFAGVAELLYSDAGIAERVAAVGDFLRDHPHSVLPVTRAIIERGRNVSAAETARFHARLAELRPQAMALLDGAELLLMPTAPTIYRVAEVERDPLALNANLGIYANFVNLLDLAAIAVPSGFTAGGLPFGVTLVGRAFSEPVLAGIAAAFARASGLPLGAASAPAEPPRRYERDRPGELIHIDIKKLGRFEAIGHRITGDRTGRSRDAGWEFVHVCIDDHSRVAFARVMPSERKDSAVPFLEAAVAYYAGLGVSVDRVMTDNGSCYKSFAFRDACRRLGLKHIRTRAYTPKTNGKAERFIQTALREWAYARAYQNSRQRTDELPRWLHRYNR